MDLQNVSNLTIPEGEVKAIHNSNNQLLWGRVNHNTKYAGDTLQNGTPTPSAPIPIQVVAREQTVSISDGTLSEDFTVDLTSKNLFDISKVKTNGTSLVNNDDGTITVTTPSGFTSVAALAPNKLSDYCPYLKVGDTVVFSMNSTGTSKYIYLYGTGANILWNSGQSVTITQAMLDAMVLWYSSGTSSTATISDVQIELGGSATSYKPYFKLMELCRIGTYQDYIYKSGDNWYVHKATGEYTFTGSESFSKSGYSTATSWVMWWITTSLAIDVSVDDGFCEFGKVRYLNDINSVDNGVVYNNTTGTTFVKLLKTMITDWDESATDSQKNSLASAMIAGKSFYYPLANPTDTKITDTTLISQLNAIHQWLTRYGYNATVSGNLPIVIDRTNL